MGAPVGFAFLLNGDDLAAIVLTALLARTVGQMISSALALDESGNLQLPMGAAALVASCLGYFTFRNSHGDTSLVKMPFGTLTTDFPSKADEELQISDQIPADSHRGRH